MSWTQSEEYCKVLGGHLVHLDGTHLFKILGFLNENSIQSEVWMGGRSQDSIWSWSDHSEITSSDLFWSLT